MEIQPKNMERKITITDAVKVLNAMHNNTPLCGELGAIRSEINEYFYGCSANEGREWTSSKQRRAVAREFVARYNEVNLKA